MSVFPKRFMRGVTAGVTTAAMVFQPQMLVAAETVVAPVQPQVALQAPSDVQLHEQGLLVGRMVDEKGAAVANSPVSLQTGGKEVARVVTDASGRFQAKGLQGGVYQVASNGHQGVYRMWSPNTAPPAAAQGLSIVSRPDVVRGQYAGSGNPFTSAGQWIAEHPIITAGLVATAIAVPIAIDDDDDPPPATP